MIAFVLQLVVYARIPKRSNAQELAACTILIQIQHSKAKIEFNILDLYNSETSHSAVCLVQKYIVVGTIICLFLGYSTYIHVFFFMEPSITFCSTTCFLIFHICLEFNDRKYQSISRIYDMLFRHFQGHRPLELSESYSSDELLTSFSYISFKFQNLLF